MKWKQMFIGIPLESFKARNLEFILNYVESIFYKHTRETKQDFVCIDCEYFKFHDGVKVIL